MNDTVYHNSSIEGRSFLVTGGAGFIGSHLVGYLLKHNAKTVRIVDNLSTGSEENLNEFRHHPALELIVGNITDAALCMQIVKGIDYVSHQAALGSVPRSIENPLATHMSNATGFLNMMEACRNEGVIKFVYASSSSVYGDSPDLPKRENLTGSPLSPYAVSKMVDELYAGVYHRIYAFPTIGLRYFNVFGPRQNPMGPYAAAIPLFINSILAGEVSYINGDGNQTRDFTYVDNAVQANIKAMFCHQKEALGNVFNIACGSRCSINELYELLVKVSGKTGNVVHREPRIGDVADSLADISKATHFLGYLPEVKLEEGLKITYQHFIQKFEQQASNSVK
jgi:UDP-N-acetylglucosamine/UDP-N-acetylgalactosamine 4-epimerase